MTVPFRPQITHKDQPYYHEQVLLRPKALVNALRDTWRQQPLKPAPIGFRYVKLQWQKPDA